MKNPISFIGIDVSKNKLDVCLLIDPKANQLTHLVVSNGVKGFNQIIKAAQKMNFDLEQSLICFENTGIYSVPLSCFLDAMKMHYWVVPAIEIKRSKGLRRGKTDKTDARDIAFYAYTHVHRMNCSKMPETDILKLQLLYSEREKLLKAVHMLQRSTESEGFLPKEVTREISKVNKTTVKKLKQAQLQVEKRIKEIISSNSELCHQYDLITSVPGVGPLTATYLIVVTKGFKLFADWRKLACYAGVAPFEYSSGTSIKGRTKVHPLANKKLKSLLNLCALNAKRVDKDIKSYYERKTTEGKNPMLVLNAIRCKVLARVFATVNRGTPYVNLQKFAA